MTTASHSGPTGPGARAAHLEPFLIAAIGAHSLIVGLALLFATRWSLDLGGFGHVEPLFFPRQAGVFHFVVVLAYGVEYLRHRGVTILVGTKAIAVAFLVGMTAVGPVPWVVPVSAAGDAAMGLAVAWVHHLARSGR